MFAPSLLFGDRSNIIIDRAVLRTRSFRHPQSGLPGISAAGFHAEVYFSPNPSSRPH
jgi:hypothetical protein